ncbi:putative photosynthetic complex assembly protein PuhE [Parasphingorhabdus sp.]|uniref:putative photosynthetic complex assembly protein PuhE n=1 Tax=Parasphingorhabdus sp. TaxID=2709688 RepID=UPI003593524F
MVNSAAFALPFVVVIILWFVSTGLVAMLNHRLRQSFGRALIIAGLCALVGLSMLVLTSQSSAVWAVYVSFVGGLMIWAWHEISFLTGAVAGSHRDPCPQGARGWQRFSMATMALIHHEIAIAMTAGLLLSLAAVTANPTGAYTFALLAIFRLSSKLNIYRGVPNMSDELLPAHLDYLKSYFGPQHLRPTLVLSIMAILGVALYFGLTAVQASTAHETAQAGLLCCLSLLAALEHFFFAIPFRDSRLWQWALGEPKAEKEI